MRRLFSRLLVSAVLVLGFKPTSAPHATRFRKFVLVLVPGIGMVELTHEQAAALAAQLSPTLTQR